MVLLLLLLPLDHVRSGRLAVGPRDGHQAQSQHGQQRRRRQHGERADAVRGHLGEDAARGEGEERGQEEDGLVRGRGGGVAHDLGAQPGAAGRAGVREGAGHVRGAQRHAAELRGHAVVDALGEGQDRQGQEAVAAGPVHDAAAGHGDGAAEEGRGGLARGRVLAVAPPEAREAGADEVGEHEHGEARAVDASEAAGVARVARVVRHRAAHADDRHGVHHARDAREQAGVHGDAAQVAALLHRHGGRRRRRRLLLRGEHADGHEGRRREERAARHELLHAQAALLRLGVGRGAHEGRRAGPEAGGPGAEAQGRRQDEGAAATARHGAARVRGGVSTGWSGGPWLES
mmetsp:Transcript_86610/g.187305  ORF Transcript_86610/g.187305 Transcript_86610/m.187305 type:complete len:346 (+) Transcript_86610:362-1399(+)